MDVTATFTQDEYNLITHINGKGEIDIDPQKDSYLYGDVITLTAIPDENYPYWHFHGWSGDIISTNNPITHTITSTTHVTAKFLTYLIFPFCYKNSVTVIDPLQP